MSIDRSTRAGGFKSHAEQETASEKEDTTEVEGRPGEALAGTPGQDNDDCTQSYTREWYKFSDQVASAESSPSTGWRRVYVEMEVFVDGGR